MYKACLRFRQRFTRLLHVLVKSKMSFPGSTISWAALAGLLLLLWKLVRNYVLRSPLDAIPGPTPPSPLKGTCRRRLGPWLTITDRLQITGNMAQLQNRGAWSFLDHLTNDYGQIVKCTGMLGVNGLFYH